MLPRLGQRIAAIFRAIAPDPFVIAVLLTLLTIALALLLTDHSLALALRAWAGADPERPYILTDSGLWKLLKFAMQMCLILVTGHVLAASPPVAILLRSLASLPRSPRQAVALVALISCALGLINWGFGLIGGAVLARRVASEMRRRNTPAHEPLLVAGAYTCMMVWHGGLSGSAPLSVSTDAGLRATLPADVLATIAPIPLGATLFSPLNLVTTAGLIAIAVVLLTFMSPKDAASCERLPGLRGDDSAGARAQRDTAPSAADRPGAIPRLLEETPIINLVLAAMIGFWAWGYYLPAELGNSGIASLSLDAVNLTMLMLGLVLHATPRRFIAAVDDAAGACAGIIIQFPLYAGIMGIMAGTGLTRILADAIAGSATHTTLPLFTFLAAALVNLFIPSGGGQWAVQGPIALQAAESLGVDDAHIVMSVAYGDQLTNMLQPFWALPLLAITGAKAREIVGYCAVVMLAGGLWIVFCLSIL